MKKSTLSGGDKAFSNWLRYLREFHEQDLQTEFQASKEFMASEKYYDLGLGKYTFDREMMENINTSIKKIYDEFIKISTVKLKKEGELPQFDLGEKEKESLDESIDLPQDPDAVYNDLNFSEKLRVGKFIRSRDFHDKSAKEQRFTKWSF